MDKLNIDKLKTVTTNLNELKLDVDISVVDKSKTFPTNLNI